MSTKYVRLAAVGLTLFVAGCAQFETAKIYGASATDGLLEGSVYGTCHAPTVASVVRRYGNDPDGQAAWEMFCGYEWRRGTGQFSLPEAR